MRHLLNFLLYKFLFAGTMFFAAGAVADVGLGGGDGAGDTSGTIGDTSGEDGADVTAEGDTATGEPGDISGNDVAEETGDSPADRSATPSTAGFSAQDKKLLDLAQKSGPAEAQRIKQLLFGEKRLLKVIPGGVKGVAELVRSVEEFGGIDGIQQLQSDIETHKQDAELFERADPRWVESGFQENPEAALKLFAHTLDFVGEHHSEQYNHLMAKVILNDLNEGLPVREIHGILAGLKDNPAAQELAKKLAAYYNKRDELARNVPTKKVDAQQKALSDREATLDKKEMDLRFTEVNREVGPQMKSDITKTLQAQAKVAGIDLNKLSAEYPTEWRDMLNTIHTKIKAAAIKDQRFIDKHFALVKKGDLKRAAAAVNAKHAAIIPDIARSVMQSYGVFKGPKKAAGDKGAPGQGNQNQPTTAGWTRVSAKPQNAAIDWSKTTQSLQLDGKYILKDGKQVVVQY
jgi:hypothetical protein